MIVASALIIFPVFISVLWSSDTNTWWQRLITKLPLLTISVGLISSGFTKKEIKKIIWTLSIVVCIASSWTIINYLNNRAQINQSYLIAQVMPTFLDDEHIRSSWLIVITMILLSWQLFIQSNQKEKIIGLILLIFFFFYLHLLAAKTGLACLYISLLTAIICFLFTSCKKLGLILLVAIIIIAAITYQIFPTLHNRIQYAVWDYEQYSNGKFLKGSDDGNRIISYKAGLNIFSSKPLIGVGFGDMRKEIIKWYAIHRPQSEEYEIMNPLNEWLVYLVASGIIGMLIFSIGMIYIFVLLFTKNIFSFCLAITLFIPLMIDDCLETQYGLVIFVLAISLAYYLKLQTKSTSDTVSSV